MLPQFVLRFAIKNIAACAILAGATASFVAKADVWVFVGTDGVNHFSDQQLDERYSLFYRAPVQKVPGEAAKAPLPATRELNPKLADFFESSPRYRKIQPVLKEAAQRYRVDYELLQALVATESGFDTSAVSPKGAIGLMQVMPDTARRFGVDSDRWKSVETKLADPKTNVQLGTRYLRVLMDMFPGKLELALAAYNAGEGAVQRAGNKVPNYKETQNYVATVGQLYAALKPVPLVQVSKTSAGRVKATYGEGYVLAGARDPYLLKAPPGRGNMVAPLQRLPAPDPTTAVD